jgi:hypothetical protein
MTDERTAAHAAYRDAVDRAVVGSVYVAVGVARLEMLANGFEGEQ